MTVHFVPRQEYSGVRERTAGLHSLSEGAIHFFSRHLSREWHPRNIWIPTRTPGKSLLKTLLMRVFKQLTKMDLDFSVIKVVSNIWHIIFLEFHGDVSFLLKTKDEIIKNG